MARNLLTGVTDNKDKSLEAPGAPDWTYLLSPTHSLSIAGWDMVSRISYAYTANTLGPLPLGGTFASMQKGRVVGLEASYSF